MTDKEVSNDRCEENVPPIETNDAANNGITIDTTKSTVHADPQSEKYQSEITQSSLEISEEISPTVKEAKKNKQGLFWIISIGNAGAQLLSQIFLPFFAAEVGVSGSLMGFITAIRNLITALFQGTIGRLSDKFGRKYLLLVGFLLCFTITTTLIFASNPVMLVVVSIIQAFSLSIVIPVWNAALGDVTEIKGRTTYIGKLTSVGQGIAVGLMLIVAGVFYFMDIFHGWTILGWTVKSLRWEVQYGTAFVIAAINFLICVIGALFLKETRSPKKDETPPKMLVALKNKDFRTFLIVNTIFGITMAALWPIYPIIQVEALGMNFYQLAITAAVYSIFFSIFGYIGGKIADRIGRKPMLIICRSIMFSVSLFYIPAILTGSWLFVFVTNVISGTGNGIFLVMMNAYSLDVSSEDTMGSFSGITQVAWGIATFLGSLGAGFIADAIESAYGMTIMIITTTIGIAIMRVLATIGYFFVKESLPKDRRIVREKTN